MASPDKIAQSGNYDFVFTLEGESLSAFTYLLEAKQYPADTALISRAVTVNNAGDVKVTLTPAETATMAVGLWYLIVKSTDTDETIQSTRRLQVTTPWI